MRSLSITLALIGVLASLGALFFVRHYTETIADTFIKSSNKDYSAYLASVANADSLALLEGLPHPDSEADLYLVESLKPDTTRHRGLHESDTLHLYDSPLSIDLVESMQLSSILSDTRYIATTGTSVKVCGNFHADYAVRFERKDTPHSYAFICFSCNDVQFTGPYPILKAYLTPDGVNELEALLGNKRKNRPRNNQRSFFEQAIELTQP